MDNDVAIADKAFAPIPRTFLDYVRSFGPGIVSFCPALIFSRREMPLALQSAAMLSE